MRHQGDLLGALSVTKRTGESLTPVEENLLAHLAGQAGLVLKNVGLTSDLQARLVELRASRQRLVTAQDEERRRLERNLHDGAQQHLVALKVKLGLAEMLMGRDVEKATADPRRSSRATPTRRWRRCATWPAGSTRRCSRTRACRRRSSRRRARRRSR